MKVVIDTNVFVSAVFWSGHPLSIIESWIDDKFQLMLTEEIYDEYSRVLNIIAEKIAKDIDNILNIIKMKAVWNTSIKLESQVCADQDDDKFIACAISSRSKIIISGDKLLLSCSGYNNIEIIRPKTFIEKYLHG